jgi:hypothetical protein
LFLPEDVEFVLRQAEQHATSALERIRSTQFSLESISDHQRRMIASIERSRTLLARLNSHSKPNVHDEPSASIERAPARS